MPLEGDVLCSEATLEEQMRHPKAWLVRPCEWYWDEGRECRRLRARVHQYFIFGHSLDCTGWSRDYQSCLSFRKNRDPEQLTALIASEESRFQSRMQASAQNDVWKYRPSAPPDWSAPLPEYMQLRSKGTLLDFFGKQLYHQKSSDDSQKKANDK